MRNYISIALTAIGLILIVSFVVVPSMGEKHPEKLVRKWTEKPEKEEVTRVQRPIELEAGQKVVLPQDSTQAQAQDKRKVSNKEEKVSEKSKTITSIHAKKLEGTEESSSIEREEEMDFSPLIYSRSIQFMPEDLELDTLAEKPEL